jgi:hypothetical protein
MTKEQGEKYFKRRSRVNPDFLTPEKLKEAAQKRKMEYVSPLEVDNFHKIIFQNDPRLGKATVDMSTCTWR